MKIAYMLPEPLRRILLCSGIVQKNLREIRLRTGRPFMIETARGECFLGEDGTVLRTEKGAYVVRSEDIKATMELLTGYSVYAFEEELRRGYFTIEGGHRVGVAGRCVTEAGNVLRLQYISFLNIRIAHECKGCSEGLYRYLYGDGQYYHTLLFAPAGHGKTTYLRDLIRLLSDNGVRVGIADERSELAACRHGIPQHDVGVRTDVMDGCPKAAAMEMLLRSMAPQVLAADEIGMPEDVEAIRRAAVSGCKVVATAHGDTFPELCSNPILQRLWEERKFERYVRVEKSKEGFQIKSIYDREGRELTGWST